MNQDLSVDALLLADAADAVRAIDLLPIEQANALLGALVDRTATSIVEFDVGRRVTVDSLTVILMGVRADWNLESRVKILSDACFYYKQIGRCFDAIPRGKSARALAKLHGYKNLERLAASALGTAYLDAACFEEACESLERSLALAHELGDRVLVCAAMTNAAALLKEMGLYQDAIEVFDKALEFEAATPRGRYLAFANALNGLFSAHRLRDDAAAFRYLRIGSELFEDNPLADIVLKTNFEYSRVLYLLSKQDNETAEILVEAAKRRIAPVRNPRVEILVDIAAALCDWASRDPARERASRKRLLELYGATKKTLLHHDQVLRALMDVHGRTLTGEVDGLERVDDPGYAVNAIKRIATETARTGMRYARELVEHTAGSNPGKELTEFNTSVKHAKFYRQVSDREAARKMRAEEDGPSGFDPFAGVHLWLDKKAGDIEPAMDEITVTPAVKSSIGVAPDRFRKHDELTAIHTDLARMRIDSLKAAMRTAAYDVAENWALAAEFFDDQTGQHCFRVGRLAGLLAAELGLDHEYCVRVEHASRLHDIGKIAVNEMILLKPGPLDASEITAMRAHTEVGAQLLEGSDDATLQMAASIAKYHHAWWNGEGYPGTSGENIPLAARICAFADVYDALTNERPYKRAWPHRLAVEQIMCEVGAHFDPHMMRPFLKVLERHIGSAAIPPSTQLHLRDMEANGLLASRRKLMDTLNAA